MTRSGRSGAWHFFHVLMCLCTGGLWLPVYGYKYAKASSYVTKTRWS